VAVPTDAVVEFGTLLEGDASDNDRVAGEDFSILATAYAACEGHAAWDPRPDFNTDGCVTGADFSLLATNYGRSGSISALASTVVSPEGQSGDVTISVEPSTQRVVPGQVFTATIRVAADGQPVDAVDSYLSFDPTYLEVVDVVTGDGLPLVLQSNAEQGRISYSAGRRLDGVPPDGEFILVTVCFRALTPTVRYGTWLGFQEGTDVFHQGESVLRSLIGGKVIVSDGDGYRLYLPLIVKGISS